ncbi:Purple acid phosphatase [Thalictrum thalictroides]|uniref:Purple acid phosphatase n=1 Tax=Thalictrum thalictroides TaxID=46969 RepID=A0A7J6VII8_THATH|nr:Purple acid phosphatase [Thalictrum thalictroides]
MDSGGECGVPTETMYYVPAINREKFWYATDYCMFHFCIADWRKGSEKYEFLERYLAYVDRQKQPWLIFKAHQVLRYSSNSYYAEKGSLRNQWEGRAYKDFGKRTRWTFLSMEMFIIMKGHVYSIRVVAPVKRNQTTKVP